MSKVFEVVEVDGLFGKIHFNYEEILYCEEDILDPDDNKKVVGKRSCNKHIYYPMAIEFNGFAKGPGIEKRIFGEDGKVIKAMLGKPRETPYDFNKNLSDIKELHAFLKNNFPENIAKALKEVYINGINIDIT